MTHPKVLTDPRLMQRYGIKKAGGNRYPLIAVSALIVSAWFIWSGYNAANPEVRSDLISFKNIDDQNAGSYRKANVIISGADHTPTDFIKVPDEMENFIQSQTLMLLS